MLHLATEAAAHPTVSEGVLWAILAAPFVGWALIVVYVRKLPLVAGWLAAAAVGVACALSYVVLFNVIAKGGIAVHTHEWFRAGDLVVNFGVRIDGLTAVMLCVVTSVAFLVQVYSNGYMKGDPGIGRYFAHMCLFTTSMIGLVLADNLFMIFIFWELVGLCSYLLIGFWFHKPSAAAAAKKAFIVTRIGDLGLLAALLLIYTRNDGNFDVSAIQAWALNSGTPGYLVTLFALGIFAGAVGKSAQFPLQVWLPDAMEGPTPVSALIHAATMVAAGVYLMARFFPVLEASPDARHVVAWIGAATALIGATIALVQTDFKRVMAYSTVSQLGLMMLGLGALGYVAAIFHLFTHAFFKSLLFLSSGNVNHATNTFDMRLMGGLRKQMPITLVTCVIGSLSLAGVVPLAGFWSKDEILLDAWRDNRGLWVVASLVSAMTAFYMFRAIFLVFFGEYKGGQPVDHHDEDSHFHGDPAHPHEAPLVMWLPLVILAVAAIGAGIFALNHGFRNLIVDALPLEIADQIKSESSFKWGVAIASSAFAAGGILLAWAIYYKQWFSSRSIRMGFAPLTNLFENKWFFDRLYEDFFVKLVLQRGWNRLLELNDKYVVDGVVNGSARVASMASDRLRFIQSGQIQGYGLGIAAGVVAVVIAVYAANPL